MMPNEAVEKPQFSHEGWDGRLMAKAPSLLFCFHP